MTVLLLAVLATTPTEAFARDAIVGAVRQRMGGEVEVVLENLVVTGEVAAVSVRAVPAPDARLGSLIRFTLQSNDGATIVGSAVARVTAIVPHAHAARPLTRGDEVTATDIAAASHVVASGPLRPWPPAAATIGGKLLRALATGACLIPNTVQAVAAVSTGQEVTVVASSDGVEARAVMVAAGSGDPGAVIRVVNRQSRRALKARVVSAGIVEIIK